MTLQHRRITVNATDLHYVEDGKGPLVVLLHGFPEYWFSWRKQIPALVAAGYRVVAPDLRGYNESAKPKSVDEYRVTAVATDIAALIESLGEPCMLVGHDWGGVVAWLVAITRPELLRKLVVLNVPHPAALLRELRRTKKQKLKMIYQLFFQPPLLPELLMPLLLPVLLRRGGRFTREDVREYRKAWRSFDTRRAMANYYRAMRRHRGELRQFLGRVEMPAMLIWAEHEPVFLRATSEDLDDIVPNLRVARIAGAGHFVQTDQPEIVSELLIDFARP